MFKKRIQKLREEFGKKSLDAVLVSSVSNVIYLTGFSNFSSEEREGYLIITKNEQFILTDGRYVEAVKREAPHFELLDRTGKHLKEVLNTIKVKNLGVEEDELTVAEHKVFKKHFKKLKHFNLKTHRAVKTAEEIKKIEKAAELGDRAFSYIVKKAKPGISEKQLAVELEFFIKKHGGKFSFPPIVAFGKNSSVPHHQTGETILGGERQIILLDFGVKLGSYCSDMTRTYFCGKPTDKQKRIYETVLEAQQRAVDYINSSLRSGKRLKAAAVDKVARDYIVSKGFPSIPHSLGHGVGLEVHEHPSLSPKSKEILKEGMVFSIEPGIYLAGYGGVRIEDLFCISKIVPSETKGLFVLGKDSIRQITKSPKSLYYLR